MEYNGLYANLIFNSCIMLMWFAFQWRVLDGRRFSVWLTILLAFVINIAYTVPILLYTQAGSMLRILLMPTGPLVMAFALFYRSKRYLPLVLSLRPPCCSSLCLCR